MASFDENGKYIKTNWKAGDKITATKLNKIEESIEAVNDNDISRHVEADARLDALEAKDVAHDKELTKVKNLIEDAKDAAELGDYEINSRMQFLEDDVEQAVNDMNNAVTTIRNEMNAHTNTVNTNVDNKISAFETEFDAEVAGLKAVDAAIQNDVSEIQNDVSEIQNDMTYARAQAATVTDAYKFAVDHDGMIPSLVTLDNIEGLSSVDTNTSNQKRLVNTRLHNICTIDTSKNYFEDAVFSSVGNNAQYSKEGNNVRVWGSNDFGYMLVTFTIPTLVEGKTYCIICDNVVVTSGSPAIQVPGINLGLEQVLNGHDIEVSSLNGIFRSVANPSMLFHCGVHKQTGDVTYENVQIYEVKEMIVPDIQLNSLPNGVKDEIKDGILIKRTGHVKLADLTWVASSTNANYPGSEFVVYYTHSVTDLRVDPSSWENELGNILCNNIPSAPSMATSSADCSDVTDNRLGISGHAERSEFRIKVYRSDAPDLTSLKTWLTNNNVYAVYELGTPEFIPVNLTIKADKGDTVVINTTKTMDLTYDIQLNTRAQIDALQEQNQDQQLDLGIMRQHVDILQQFVGGITLSYDDYKGCLNFPNGLKLQWGRVDFGPNYTSGDSIDYILGFPEPFKSNVMAFICSTKGDDNAWDSICSGHPLSLKQARVVLRHFNPAVMNGVHWMAIGL